MAQRSESPEPFDRGTAGASARRRYEQLAAAREQRSRDRFGPLGGVYLALTKEPQWTTAWERGSDRERRLGRYLDSLHDLAAVIVLHDRRIPGTRANIDHLAITSTGAVWVIDAKRYAGKVRCVNKGWRGRDSRLMIGSRDCTDLAHAMARQVEQIQIALGPALVAELGAVVYPALCFVDAERSLLARPFEIDGVWIGWQRALGHRLRVRGPLEPAQLMQMAERLAAALPPA